MTSISRVRSEWPCETEWNTCVIWTQTACIFIACLRSVMVQCSLAVLYLTWCYRALHCTMAHSQPKRVFSWLISVCAKGNPAHVLTQFEQLSAWLLMLQSLQELRREKGQLADANTKLQRSTVSLADHQTVVEDLAVQTNLVSDLRDELAAEHENVRKGSEELEEAQNQWHSAREELWVYFDWVEIVFVHMHQYQWPLLTLHGVQLKRCRLSIRFCDDYLRNLMTEFCWFSECVILWQLSKAKEV